MRCRKCRKHLPAWIDGELSSALAAEIRAHVEQCTECAQLTGQLRGVDGVLEQLPTLQASDDFDASFARRLQEAKRDRRLEESRPPATWWRWPVLAAAGAGACAAVLLLVLVGGPAPKPSAHELELAMHLELCQDYDVVANLDVLEDFEVVANLGSGGEEP